MNQVVESGTRVGNETITCLAAEDKIRPLRDQIILEPIPWPFSDIFEVVYTGRALRGIVRAIGPGVYEKRYNGRKGVRTKSWDSNVYKPTEVKVGDIVQLGGLGIGGYLFTTFRWGDRDCVICSERDVTVVEQ
jgi:hypothetical protein